MHEGDDEAGFSIAFSDGTRTLEFAAWGFLSVDLAQKLNRTLCEACRDAPVGCRLVLDLRELKPLREEGQTAMHSVLSLLGRIGIREATILTRSQLTKLQMMRIVGECGSREYVRFA